MCAVKYLGLIDMTNRDLKRAARLAALLPYYETGCLRHLTYQRIADITNVGHRSTALRDVRDLAYVSRERARLEIIFGKLLHRRHNRTNRNL
jgi:hypothetical protein